MDILLKYPTRGRPRQFLETLSGWLGRAGDPDRVRVLVTVDDDDESMNDAVLALARRLHPEVEIRRDPNRTKVEACNRGLADYPLPWDVVLLVSDDMFCCRQGWDEAVRADMQEHHDGKLDGGLWYYDGYQNKINTVECVGHERWRKFGYLYHPAYASFFCDDESTAVGLRDGKLVHVPTPICLHEHPCWGAGMKRDALYDRNDEWWDRDEATYVSRAVAGFPASAELAVENSLEDLVHT